MKKHNIEQRTDEWHHLRKGKITGTTLKSIMGTAKAYQDAIYELVAERLTIGIDDDSENPMDRGTRLESEALAVFELEYNKQVETTGFAEDDSNPIIANSPDGLIGEKEAVEVKCPGGKNYVKAWLTNKVPDEYEWQVVQYFIVNEKLETLYFVLYNPDIPAHPMHVILVKKEEIQEDIVAGRAKQEEVIQKVEEILSKIIKI